MLVRSINTRFSGQWHGQCSVHRRPLYAQSCLTTHINARRHRPRIPATSFNAMKYSQFHHSDVIMGTMASQITSLMIVYLAVYSGADQRKHQSSASLAFVWGIHQWPVNSPHKWPVIGSVSIWWRHHSPRKAFCFVKVNIRNANHARATAPIFDCEQSFLNQSNFMKWN